MWRPLCPATLGSRCRGGRVQVRLGGRAGPILEVPTDERAGPIAWRRFLASHAYPSTPRAAVAAVVCRTDGLERRYLLAQRGKAPRAGSWSLPGGSLELGEAVLVGVAREVEEECGLTAATLRWHPTPITATDAIFFGEVEIGDGDPEFHYLIAQCFAWHAPGPLEEAVAGDDALDLQWLSVPELARRASVEGLWYGRNVIEVVRIAESLIECGIIAPEPS
mmetsp:Transcript_71157/g.180095  ORF Transcript_71157/g.180095 Transcript_71157/m.180095 type:complete len:221 (+) Transcript_71157:110-772(+)